MSSLINNRLAWVLTAATLLPPTLVAQSNAGSLSGRVTREDGRTPLAGVVVTVVQRGTNLTRSRITDEDGTWHAQALPVGDYRVLLQAGGQSHTLGRTVNLGMDTLVRFRWPAEASALVTVEAVASGLDQVNASSAEVGVNVDSETIAGLPLLDRNVNSAAVLAPGVQIIQGSQVDPTKKTSTYIVAGDGQGRGTNFNVDGADNNSSDVGGAVLNVPIDAIEQFQVVTNMYKAEFGRSNAGFMNIVTKSGSNAFTGTANWQYSDQALRARKTDEGTKAANSSNAVSFETAGPIIKDKLFFMVAGEQTRSSAGQYFTPTAIATYPVLGKLPTTISKMNLYVKADWNVSQNGLVSGHYARYYDTAADQLFGGSTAVNDNVSPSMTGTAHDSIVNAGLKATATFGAILWESTANYFHYLNVIRPAHTTFSNGVDTMVSYAGGEPANSAFNQGEDGNAFQNTGVQRRQWKNELTALFTFHSLKGGVDLQMTDYPTAVWFWPTASPEAILLNYSPAVTFANAMTPQITAAEVAGMVTHNSYGNPPTSFKGYGIYGQDDWTVNGNWQVYYGYRLDWDTQLDYYTRFDPIYQQMHTANPDLPGIGAQAPRTHKYGSPRLQVLYKPDGDEKIVFKFGYGKFTASTIDNVVGFSRSMNGPFNGGAGNNTYFANNGNFTQGSTLQLGNVAVPLKADFTPYNYFNNINGLYNQIQAALNTGLTTANFNTPGKTLLASDFAYPTTGTVSLGLAYRFNERSALELTMLVSDSKHQTVLLFGTDGSSPATWSPNPAFPGYLQGRQTYSAANYLAANYDSSDSIFYSNQASHARQLQGKYSYSTPNLSFLTTLVLKADTSTSGGDGGAFSNSGYGDFFGTGAPYPWRQGPEHPTAGAERVAGTFALNLRWDTGTRAGLLGQWHSGKAYDTYLGGTYGMNVANGGLQNDAIPNPWVGTGWGHWNLNLGLRVSQDVEVGAKAKLQPYVAIDNLLNNYDYGNNFQNQQLMLNDSGTGNVANPYLGQRLPGFQTNSPRNAAFGLRVTW